QRARERTRGGARVVAVRDERGDAPAGGAHDRAGRAVAGFFDHRQPGRAVGCVRERPGSDEEAVKKRRRSGARAESAVMLRTIVLLGAGVVLGAVGAHGWIARSAESLAGGPGGGSFLDLDGVRRVLGLAGTRQAPQLQARAEAYRAAASFDDAYTLEKALAAAAARPDSPMQTLELDALLMRLAEIDAQRALSAAQSSRLGERFVAAVLAAWVEDDADA